MRNLAIWLGASFLAGAAGSLASVQARTFYSGLSRPEWAPPGWIFGPVWTVLYVLMGIAAARIADRERWPSAALGLFVAQLVLNAAWTWIFFGARRADAALVEILVLDAVLVATLVAFAKRDAIAGALLVPYLGWTLFASALTFELWRRN